MVKLGGEFGGRLKGLLHQQDATKTEPIRVLVGESLELPSRTTVTIQILCGADLEHAKYVPLAEAAMGGKTRVATKVAMDGKTRITRIVPSEQDPADTYLLEPDGNGQSIIERGKAAYDFLKNYGFERLTWPTRAADGNNVVPFPPGEILEAHLTIVE